MDKIYSRKRVKLPKVIYKNFNNSDNNKKKVKFILILLVTIICNEETTKIIQNYKYEDLVTIYKDSNENITMLKSNITPINLIISDVAEKIQKRIECVKQDEVGIRVGSFTGSKILSGLGPVIPIKLSTVGNVQTDLRSEFKEAGINQTVHRIYLQVDCEIGILTPYSNIDENISNQVLIAENVIVGKIPETYYNLQGLNSNQAVDVIE